MLTFRPRHVLLLALVLLIPRIAEAQDRSPDAQRIAALVAEYDRSWNDRDTVAVGRLMAPGYQYFTSVGGVRSRDEMLSFLGSPEYVVAAAQRSEVVVTRSGPVAVVSSRWRGNGTYKGKRFVDDQRCGLVWLERDGAWRVVSEHCVQITPDPY